MNFKTTIILVILLAVVGGYFYFVEFGRISQYEAHQQAALQGEQPEGDPVFPDLLGKENTITTIQVVRGNESFTAQKQNGAWFQSAPVFFPLSDYTPDAVARQFANLRYVEQLRPGENDNPTLTQMGLDQPRAVVTIQADDTTISLKLGKLTFGGNGYVQIEGEDTAYVVDSSLFGSVLDASITDWRKTSLDLPQASSAHRVEQLVKDGDHIKLVKQDGKWKFDDPAVVCRVDQQAVDNWLGAISRVWISEFIEDQPTSLALYGLDHPAMQFTIVEPGEDETFMTHHLVIGNQDLEGERRYAAWTRDDQSIEVVFSLNLSTADNLAKQIDDLRDPNVLAADVTDVRGLTVQQDDRITLNLTRDLQTGYHFADPNPGYEPDYSVCHDLITQLCELNSRRFVPVDELTDRPVATVTLKLVDDETVRFSIFDRGEDKAVATEGETIAYLVTTSDLDTLLGPPLNLRNRTVLDISTDSIERVQLRRDDGVTFTFQPDPDKEDAWQVTDHELGDPESAKALIESLNPLRAQRWLDEPVSPSADWVHLTIEPRGGAPIVIQVDSTTGQAIATGVDTPFVLPASMLERLAAEYRETTALPIKAEQIQAVQLTEAEKSVTLTRQDQRYVSDAGDLAQSVIAKVFDTLAGLRVERFIPADRVPTGEPSFTITLTLEDDSQQTLRVFDSGSDTAVVTLDPVSGPDYTSRFTLSRETIDALRAPLDDLEAPTK
ncbi:MAG: hypothetical protein Kow00105_05370 [Phycisphaeraceae bacterium]